MKQEHINTIKLGSFVLAGLAFLVLLLYFIGKNQDLFHKTFVLKARFANVQGLRKGNNVRYAGIDAGTVRKVEVLNDSVIELVLQVKMEMRGFIRKNAVVSIGTDGLMGSPIVNIRPSGAGADFIEEGDILSSVRLPETSDMLQVLNSTNNDIAAIAAEVRLATQRFNNSKAVWAILEDESLPQTMKASLSNIHDASVNVKELMDELELAANQIRKGRGPAAILLNDTTLAGDIQEAIVRIKAASTGADSLVNRMNTLARNISQELESGKGTVPTLLKDEATSAQLREILDNIREGSKSFNESMEAMQHNFLLRGYFKKQKQLRTTRDAKTNAY